MRDVVLPMSPEQDPGAGVQCRINGEREFLMSMSKSMELMKLPVIREREVGMHMHVHVHNFYSPTFPRDQSSTKTNL